ncbi:hypothetical protein N658DRAFT_330857 [Parathielavia hyrcaniae]|uniref:Transposase n=1 Tax=Parathielavia hyrcaniae TaxID=113614 RepID=A0AAN6Q3M9_9PEZI|nr:hypothetical protein N658DRAFT_330857 [Parathielavia hyrcaniae]
MSRAVLASPIFSVLSFLLHSKQSSHFSHALCIHSSQRVDRYIHDFGHTYREIAARTQYTLNQIHRAIHDPVTLQKKKPRKGAIRTPQREQLRQWLETGRNRYIPLYQLPARVPSPLQGYGETALTRAIHDLGWASFVRPKKIDLTEEDLRRRIQWCQEQLRLRPRPEDWEDVLFSDETWAVNDPTWKKRVHMDKTNDLSKYALKKRRPKGWMFWGSFTGRRKGPFFVWEKEYGSICADNYIQYILPLVGRFNQEQRIVFQQDNASAHRARKTKARLQELGIEVL